MPDCMTMCVHVLTMCASDGDTAKFETGKAHSMRRDRYADAM